MRLWIVVMVNLVQWMLYQIEKFPGRAQHFCALRDVSTRSVRPFVRESPRHA